MINIKENVDKLKGGGSSIPAGIHENVVVESVEVGNTYIDIHLKDSSGRVKKDRLFDPDEKYVTPKDGESKEEAFKRVVNDASQVLLQYVVSATDFELPGTVSTYADLKKLAGKALEKAVHPVNLKMVPHRTEPTWSDFPKYAPYVERFKEGFPATLRYSKYELGLINKPAKPATQEKDPFSLF